MAVLIAIVNLVVLSIKLDNQDAAGTSQSAAAAEPAPPAPLGHTSATTLKEYTVTPRPSEVAAGRAAFKVRKPEPSTTNSLCSGRTRRRPSS